ncbi:vitelline membrane outer layer protein 1-like [Oratosquilla oratoria]|uniref:vitelline membrane outer layer protein 1-like n=1 Tax=Oratosquilla oratoria TaxID=337810 RepID=UPI003F758B1C
MGKAFLLFVVLIGFAAAEVIEDEEDISSDDGDERMISQYLNLDNPYDAGEWGSVSLCPNGSFAHAFEVKFEEYNAVDETAVNAIKLYCRNEHEHDLGYITSSEGQHGRWYGMRICSSGFLTGMRGQVLGYQGIFHDDVAVENVELECNHGSEILPGVAKLIDVKFNTNGDWSAWDQCHIGTAICGLQTRFESPVLADDVAIADFTMFCCEL